LATDRVNLIESAVNRFESLGKVAGCNDFATWEIIVLIDLLRYFDNDDVINTILAPGTSAATNMCRLVLHMHLSSATLSASVEAGLGTLLALAESSRALLLGHRSDSDGVDGMGRPGTPDARIWKPDVAELRPGVTRSGDWGWLEAGPF
jgi:hypothetical protein